MDDGESAVWPVVGVGARQHDHAGAVQRRRRLSHVSGEPRRGREFGRGTADGGAQLGSQACSDALVGGQRHPSLIVQGLEHGEGGRHEHPRLRHPRREPVFLAVGEEDVRQPVDPRRHGQLGSRLGGGVRHSQQPRRMSGLDQCSDRGRIEARQRDPHGRTVLNEDLEVVGPLGDAVADERHGVFGRGQRRERPKTSAMNWLGCPPGAAAPTPEVRRSAAYGLAASART